MRHNIVLFIISCISLISNTYIYSLEYGQNYDMRGSSTENFSSHGLVLSIHADKKRFILGETIPVQLSVKNESLFPVTFYINKQFLKNYTLIVKDENGQSLPVKNIGAQNNKQLFYQDYTGTSFDSRSIVLQPGESFNREINIDEIVQLSSPVESYTRYNISAYFYPDPVQSPDLFISSSNNYGLIIDNFKTQQMISRKNDNYLQKEITVSPKEIIYLALAAEFSRDWPNYFKYIDLTELIRDYPDFARDYVKADQIQRSYILGSFRSFLSNSKQNNLLKFEILSEKIEAGLATVGVRALRKIDGFEREFYYTYYMTPKNSLWQITGLQSQFKK